MADKIRWGILGVAKINDRLIPAFAAADNAVLTAIASRSADKARAAAAAHAIPVAHDSYDALLADPGIDAVYNPLPNTLHAEWTRKAADHGKHVLCEKPLCPTAPEAAELVEYCRDRGVKLMDGFMWPHHPRTAELRRLLDDGAIGPVRSVHGVFTFSLPMDPANIRLRPDMAGGSLLDVGCYPVYGIRWAMRAEPVRVTALAESRFGVDVAMFGTLEFADGAVAQFECGFTSPMRQWLELTGPDGSILIPQMWLPEPSAAAVIQRGEVKELREFAGADQIVRMLENFGRFVRENRPVSPSPEEAVKTLRVLDALAASARERRPVELA